jgi:hypothetical protein
MNDLKLLKGDPIPIRAGLYLYPLYLSDIADIGENNYNYYLHIFRIDKSLLGQLNGEISHSELDEIYKYSELEFVLYLCGQDSSLLYFFMESLRVFLKSEIKIEKDVGIIIENEEVSITLDNDLFLEIKKIISKQNYLKVSEEPNFKPANDKAKELIDKMKKAKEKIQKQNKEEGLSLKDIISIVSTYSNDLNIMSVWKLTVYQLYESYLRLVLWDEYHNKFILLPHTSDSQSLDLKHWATDINKIK